MGTENSTIAQTYADKAKKFIEETLEVTPEQRKNLSEYDLGYPSSVSAIKPQITDGMSLEEIRKICEAERKMIFKDIDSRIKDTKNTRKDEMTTWERGYLHGAIDVAYCF